MHPIKRERAKQRLSLRELGRRSGVPAGTISGIERGSREPQILTLAKIADALGVDVEDLAGEATIPKADAPRRSGRESELEGLDAQTLASLSGEITDELEWVRGASLEELREKITAGLREELDEVTRALNRAIHRGGPPTEPEISKQRRRRRGRPLLQVESDDASEVG